MKRVFGWIFKLERTDFGAVFCGVIVVLCLVLGRWPGLAVLAMTGVIFCVVVPRMEGPFGFQGGSGTQIGGTFSRNRPPIVVEAVKPPTEQGRLRNRPPQSSSKGPDLG